MSWPAGEGVGTAQPQPAPGLGRTGARPGGEKHLEQENRGCRLPVRGGGFLQQSHPQKKGSLSLRVQGMGCGDPVDSGPQEDKVLGLTLIPGDTVDTDLSSPQGSGPWAEISGAVQGANIADPGWI